MKVNGIDFDNYFNQYPDEKGYFGKNYTPFECFPGEFGEFYSMLKGELAPKDYREFIAPVFILNAIDRSLKSGKEEPVHAIPEI